MAQIRTDYVNNAVSATRLTYIHVDHLNTPRAMTDSTQTVVWRWDSDAFGFVPPNNDPDGNLQTDNLALRFPGQLLDADNGLSINGFREYDPSLGRYALQSDPIGLRGGLNTYAYVGGNPIRYIDPLGLATTIIINNNTPIIGTHAGLHIGNSGSGEPLLYDPGGSYLNNNGRGSGGYLFGGQASLQNYVQYQNEDGPSVQMYVFPTTPEEEAEIANRIMSGSDPGPGSCSSGTSSALNGIGPFKNLGTYSTPRGLGNALKQLQKK